MSKHQEFMEKFQQCLPTFLQGQSKIIYEDIISQITQSLKDDGVEFRGYFSMKSTEGKVRDTIKFKDLSKNEGE